MKKRRNIKTLENKHGSAQSNNLTPTFIAQRKMNQTERERRVTQICTNIARHELVAATKVIITYSVTVVSDIVNEITGTITAKKDAFTARTDALTARNDTLLHHIKSLSRTPCSQ